MKHPPFLHFEVLATALLLAAPLQRILYFGLMFAFQKQSRRSRLRFRPRVRERLLVERLESRRLLATLDVNTTADAVDIDAGDGVCEISPGGPCSLRAAIQEANALANSDGPDRINLPAGSYLLSLAGIDDQTSATGDLDITADLILQGAGASGTIIDAGGIDRVLDVVRGVVTISGVTVQGGFIQDVELVVAGMGGGIRNEGDLRLSDSVVTGNSATFGAGVGNYSGTLRILRSTISGNGDEGTQRGGGIANYSNYDPATLEVTDSTITGNRADTGGGINTRTYDGIANATIASSTISGNTAQNGGGISNRSTFYYADTVAAQLTIVGSTVSGNMAASSGGGIRSEADSQSFASVVISNSTIAANTASGGDGGGIVIVPSSAADLTIDSVIVAGNTAGGDGPDLSSQATNGMFSLIESPLGHAVVDGDSGNIVGQNPLLGPLEDNGGPTKTHLLLDGSPAVDQGSNAQALASDQRGSEFLRTVDDPNIANAADGTDIGAVEVGQLAATMDFGDAPQGTSLDGIARRYPTRLDADGARHQITDHGPTLGSIRPDPEPDGRPSQSATGDDAAGIDDEDLFNDFPLVLIPGQQIDDVSISHHGGVGGAFLSVWMDLNLDGDWDDVGEQILSDVPIPAGPASTSLSGIMLSPDTPLGTTFIRVRVSTQSGLTPRGEAIDGEVEDVAASVACLSAEPIRLGRSRLTYACATPGSFSAFVQGTSSGSRRFDPYGIDLGIADAEEFAIAVADVNGVATAFLDVNEADMDQPILVQAFQMTNQVKKSEIVSLDSAVLAQSGMPPEGNPLAFDLDAVAGDDRSPLDSMDVNEDGQVSALDALVVVNFLANDFRWNETIHLAEAEASLVQQRLDTNLDSRVSALDALLIINHLSRRQLTTAAGETTSPLVSHEAVDTLLTTTRPKTGDALGMPPTRRTLF